MPNHQFPEKTLLVGFTTLPPSGLLIIMATISERAPSDFPGLCQTQQPGNRLVPVGAGNGFYGFRTSIQKI